MDTRARLRDDAGLTLVEVMMAMVILILGVLGTLVLVQGGLASTNRTTAREQATNLARDLIERSRQADYSAITYAGAATTLKAMLPASDAVAAGATASTFTVTRRNVTYDVSVLACSIDDPSDGAGQGDATACAAPTTTNVPGSTTPGIAGSVNVLGIPVTVGGSLLDTVCDAVGTNSAILNQLTALVSNAVPLSACTSTGNGTVPYDSTPDDMRRVRVDVSWTRGGAGSVSQTTLLTNPR